MSAALKISLAANVAFALILFYFIGRVLRAEKPAEQSTAYVFPSAVPESSPAQPQSEPQTFRWRQLESSNYTTYVANLRRIECPEQTIRDLITADVDTLYSPRRTELERRKAAIPEGSIVSGLNRQKVDSDLEGLKNEEGSIISFLIGSQPEASIVAAARSGATRKLVETYPPGMPLVFQEVSSTTMPLDDRQREVILHLQEKFRAEVGQDPSDPAYAGRWQNAQRNSDSMLRGLLGSRFFTEYQLRAGETVVR